MNALFVYKDGSIGQRAIERALPSYRIARRLPVSVLAAVEPSVDSISVTYDEYALRGRMLDERPIYCADGFDVVEAWAEILVMNGTARRSRLS